MIHRRKPHCRDGCHRERGLIMTLSTFGFRDVSALVWSLPWLQARSDPAVTVTTHDLLEVSRADGTEVLSRLGGSPDGLTIIEAGTRLALAGANTIADNRRPSVGRELLSRALNPLNGLLLILAVVSLLVGDTRAAVVIAVMVVLAIVTGFIRSIARTKLRPSCAPWSRRQRPSSAEVRAILRSA